MKNRNRVSIPIFCFFVVINLYYEISIISMSKTALNSLRQE